MKIFSVPINPKLTEEQFIEFVEFCELYKDYIADLYFTCRIPPFTQDAMGEIFESGEDYKHTIDTALFIQEKTGISVSATFNNITIKPTQENLDLWIKSFKPLYESGVRVCTLPFVHWLATNQIKTEFPELEVRSSILMNTRIPTDVYNLVSNGFDSICVDRSLLRDKDTLLKIIDLKKIKPFKLVLLANEGCLGKCPMMSEHFLYNNLRTDECQYLHSSISRVSCPKWDNDKKATVLKLGDIPPWKEEWDEFISHGVDIFKMHGRESIDKLYETMDIVRNYVNNETILYDINLKLNESNTEKWRKIIKNCRFECYSCNFCDMVIDNEVNPKIVKTVNILVDSVNSDFQTNVEGLSSPRIDKFLNELGKISTTYLEIGCLGGRTFSSVLSGNKLNAIGVDNWTNGVTSENGNISITTTKDDFITNIKPYIGENDVTVFDCNFINVNKESITDIDLFLYDGNHSYDSTKLAVEYFSSQFADECIMIFDDANWDGVVKGALAGIDESGLTVLYEKKMLNNIEDPNMWWNGLYILIVKNGNTK